MDEAAGRMSIAAKLMEKVAAGEDEFATNVERPADGDDNVLRHILPGLHLASIRVDRLAPAPEGQARRDFNPERLQTLADSVKRSGLREPIIVTPHGAEPGHFQIVAGERRWRAAQLAGLKEIPCLVDPHLAERSHKLLAQAEENLHRENLNAVEEATVLVQLMEARMVGVREAGELIGKSYLQARRLYQLHHAVEPIKEAVRRGRLDGRAALEMTRIYNKLAKEDGSEGKEAATDEISKLIEKVVGEKWPIRKIEQYATNLAGLERSGSSGSPEADAVESSPPASAPSESGAPEGQHPGPLFTEDGERFVVNVAKIKTGDFVAEELKKLLAALDELSRVVRVAASLRDSC